MERYGLFIEGNNGFKNSPEAGNNKGVLAIKASLSRVQPTGKRAIELTNKQEELSNGDLTHGQNKNKKNKLLKLGVNGLRWGFSIYTPRYFCTVQTARLPQTSYNFNSFIIALYNPVVGDRPLFNR
ncbi:unnamed protein product [Nezara viridula]|uniref:Uncharacterized protein n=1 Tax=Nezara viridula TaxID=85310 RepID=A0A9P0E2V8_NEZVI|nr:unnamed protein product [Nezara viridula]